MQLQFNMLHATCDASEQEALTADSSLAHWKSSTQEKCTQYQLQVGALEAQCNALNNQNMMFKTILNSS